MSDLILTCAVCGTKNRDRAGRAETAVMTCGRCGRVIEAGPPGLFQTEEFRVFVARSLLAVSLISFSSLVLNQVSLKGLGSGATSASRGGSSPSRPASDSSEQQYRRSTVPSTPESIRGEEPKQSEVVRNSGPTPTPPPPRVLKAKQFPDGIRLSRQTDPMAPFSLKTPEDGQMYFAKLVDLDSGQVVARIYMRGGQTRRFDIPLGSYELRYATGTEWYGEKDLFGESTLTSKANSTFDFHIDGNRVSGHRVELIRQVAGNLTTTSIPKDGF